MAAKAPFKLSDVSGAQPPCDGKLHRRHYHDRDINGRERMGRAQSCHQNGQPAPAALPAESPVTSISDLALRLAEGGSGVYSNSYPARTTELRRVISSPRGRNPRHGAGITAPEKAGSSNNHRVAGHRPADAKTRERKPAEAHLQKECARTVAA